MKKIFSILICLVLILNISSFSASAKTNYCQLFKNAINNLRWSVDLFENNLPVEENESFSTDVIIDYAKFKTISNYLTDDNDLISIPEEVFEAKAKKCFAVVDINALREFEEDCWDGATQQSYKRRIYDPDKKAYTFLGAGGIGDSTQYAIRGYVENSGKYTVYSHFFDISEELAEASGTEGKDYFVLDGKKYAIIHSLKNVVETDGTDVKFHSWQQISAVPELDGLITPSTKLEDDKKPENGGTTSTPSNPQNPSQTPSDSNGTTSTPDDNAVIDPGKVPDSNPQVTVLAPKSVSVVAEENVFPPNTTINVSEIKNEEEIKKIETALADVSKKFVAYDISATYKNATVQPDGKVTVTFDIPEGYSLDKIAVFYVDQNGKRQELQSIVYRDTNTVVAELSHFSIYVVAETEKTNSSDIDKEILEIIDEGKEEETNNSTVIWLLIGLAVLIIAGGAAVCFFIYKKRAK